MKTDLEDKREKNINLYRKNAKIFYDTLERNGINTSISKIKRIPDKIPLIINNQIDLVREGNKR